MCYCAVFRMSIGWSHTRTPLLFSMRCEFWETGVILQLAFQTVSQKYLEGLELVRQRHCPNFLVLSLGISFHFVSSFLELPVYRSPVMARIVAPVLARDSDHIDYSGLTPSWEGRNINPKRRTVWLRASSVKYLSVRISMTHLGPGLASENRHFQLPCWHISAIIRFADLA
jgi:hypothetical protein